MGKFPKNNWEFTMLKREMGQMTTLFKMGMANRRHGLSIKRQTIVKPSEEGSRL